MRHVVGDPEVVSAEGTPRILDIQCWSQAEIVGMEIENLTVTDVTCPLITKRMAGQYIIQWWYWSPPKVRLPTPLALLS